MKILVIGAAGWQGRALLANLVGRHTVRAFDQSMDAWNVWADVDGEWDGERLSGDIADFDAVHAATDGMDGIIHLAAYFGNKDNDPLPWMINVKGIFNVLESARRRSIEHVVHMGSCQVAHPDGKTFFTADVRRPDATVYGLTKRLQEETCRAFHANYGMRIIVLRPALIVDTRIALTRDRKKLGPDGWAATKDCVCRHDLAEACRLAVESDSIDFDIFHIVGAPEAEKTCDVARSREVLGLEYKGNLEKYMG